MGKSAGECQTLQLPFACGADAPAHRLPATAACPACLQMELRTREDQLAQVRAWLDEAQEELVTTQAALQEREGECRRVGAQLAAMQAVAASALVGCGWVGKIF